jgi:hypothetical protein
LKPLKEPAGHLLAVMLIEVVVAKVSVGAVVLQQVKDDDQDGVGDGDRRLLAPRRAAMRRNWALR